MRKLASELGVTPMAIYYDVPNKDALFDRISDTVLARVPRPTPTGTAWREELATFTIHGWQLMLEYPGLSQQLAKRPPSVESDAVAQKQVDLGSSSSLESMCSCEAWRGGCASGDAFRARK
jgi:AcrR family transcriptional regulator